MSAYDRKWTFIRNGKSENVFMRFLFAGAGYGNSNDPCCRNDSQKQK